MEAASKKCCKDGLSLFDDGTNNDIDGHDIQLKDEECPSNCFATINGITDHKITNKQIECYCDVSPPKNRNCFCMYGTEGNIPLNSKVDDTSNVFVTSVGNKGNTIVMIAVDDTNIVPVVEISNYPVSLEVVHSSDDDILSNSTFQTLICSY